MAENKHISIGRLGEDIASGHLERLGFSVVERNYRRKCGELDIVAKKRGVLHFVEVKAGSWDKAEWPKDGSERYRPEDHMHEAKRARMGRAIQTYLAEHGIDPETEWTADLVVVLINNQTHKAQVRTYNDIVLGD
jgi:putative endonuclease